MAGTRDTNSSDRENDRTHWQVSPPLLNKSPSETFPSLDDLESTVSWIEQDSTTQPNQYLEDCNTKIFGE
jgi:hypothetical protein